MNLMKEASAFISLASSRNRARTVCLVILGASLLLTVLGLLDEGFSQPETKLILNFKEADIKDVLRAISQQAGVNIVTKGGLEGKVTVQLSGVDFEKALSFVLETVGAGYTWSEGTVVVTPGKLETRTLTFDFLEAGSAKKPLERLLSQKGKIEVVELGESQKKGFRSKLVVIDSPEKMREIERVAKELDSKPRLVAIEARLVETVLGRDERLGINWNIAASASGASIPVTAPFDKTAAGGDMKATPNTQNLGAALGQAFPPNEFFPYAPTSGFSFGKLSAAEFAVALEMISSRTKTNLVSNPKVTTLEDKEAEIMVGTVVPIAIYERHRETGVLEITGYEELRVGVNLSVIPHVASDGSVLLTVRPNVSEIIDWRGQFNERPVMSTREALTQVVVKDGETLAIGGLVREVDTEVANRVPFLARIPLIGRLFTHKKIVKEKVDLLIFITPRILP